MEGSDNNVYSRLSLTLGQALYGTAVTLKTSSGSTVKLKIKAGTQDGKVLRLTGQGERGEQGGLGDLLLKVRIVDHPFFRKDGLHIIGKIEVSPVLALYGGKTTVSGPDDEPIEVEIPKNSRTGDVVTFPGMGFADCKSRGDLKIELKVGGKIDKEEILYHQLRSEWLN